MGDGEPKVDGVNTVALTDVAIDQIKEMIVSGGLPSGPALESQPASAMSVSIPDAGLDCTVLHLVQVRRILEPAATALAAARVDKDDVRLLREILDRSETMSSPAEFVDLDADFHRRIIDIVGNPILSRQLQVLSTMTKRLRVLRGKGPYALEQSRREHRAILAALAAHDTQIAAAAAAAHISGVEQWLMNYLDHHG